MAAFRAQTNWDASLHEAREMSHYGSWRHLASLIGEFDAILGAYRVERLWS
jgi:hypothetical protein